MTYNLKWILLLVFLMLGKLLLAQQCGYENYYLFVVNVHTKDNTEKIPNLKMYLVDENDKAVTVNVAYQEENNGNTEMILCFLG
jgi:hypothetical protein